MSADVFLCCTVNEVKSMLFLCLQIWKKETDQIVNFFYPIVVLIFLNIQDNCLFDWVFPENVHRKSTPLLLRSHVKTATSLRLSGG